MIKGQMESRDELSSLENCMSGLQVENAKYCTLVLLTPYVDWTLVSVTENHVLQSALYEAMILHTFLGTAKKSSRTNIVNIGCVPLG